MTLDHGILLISLLTSALWVLPTSTNCFQSNDVYNKYHSWRMMGRKSIRNGNLLRSPLGRKETWGQIIGTSAYSRHSGCSTMLKSIKKDPIDLMSSSDSSTSMYQSYIETVKCQNFMYNAAPNADINNDDDDDDVHIDVENNDNSYPMNNEIEIHLGDQGPNLVAVTGETGSGKSLLVFKVFQLVLGERVSPTILRGSTFASGEVVIKLGEPHLSHIQEIMQAIGLNPTEIIPMDNNFGTLSLKRTILQQNDSTAATTTTKKKTKKANNRFRSKCEINGKQITLKALRYIAKPLITTVDAAVASSALSQPKARAAIIDTGVSNLILSKTKSSMKVYREKRKRREEIEREIENRIMPASFTPTDSEENIELLKHWIAELDEFESRILNFQESIVSSRGTASLLKDSEYDDSVDDGYDDLTTNNFGSSSLSFIDVLKKFADCSWENDKTSGQDSFAIATSFYSNLLDLRDGVKTLDSKLASAHASCDALSSLSSSQSVAYALEECRRHLFDATSGYEGNREVNEAAETSHELLNKLEDALSSCANFMSDDSSGLLSTLEKMRGSVQVSVEEIDFLIADWGSMARKHGVSPYSLPPLHHSLRQELDGNVEARSMLPKAQEEENAALSTFQDACDDLSRAREDVCSSLTKSVTARLKDLGMEGSTFTAKLNTSTMKCTDPSAYSDANSLGIDSIDFLLTHRSLGDESTDDDGGGNKGSLDVIGSSGEKARLLLAIETDLPGSIGASCNSINGNSVNDMVEIPESSLMEIPGPVSVVYDEIDAHVGGRAAVSLAKLLADQTQIRNNEKNDSVDARRSQIISITHSPSVAAIADRHVVVQKQISSMNSRRGKDSVLVNSVRGLSRLEEISRMASGDLAVKESIKFAEALLRDGIKYKSSRTS